MIEQLLMKRNGSLYGVYLEFTDGKKLLIGSQKPEEFVGALNLALDKRQL